MRPQAGWGRTSSSRVGQGDRESQRVLDTHWDELRQLLPLAQVLNIDETGHKDNGQRMQTWVFRGVEYIFFKIAETRGTAVLLESLGADFGKIIGCNYFSSYRCYMPEFGGVLQFFSGIGFAM